MPFGLPLVATGGAALSVALAGCRGELCRSGNIVET